MHFGVAKNNYGFLFFYKTTKKQLLFRRFFSIIVGKFRCGQLTQLGECLLDVEKVRGSSPLLPTSRRYASSRNKNSPTNNGRAFLLLHIRLRLSTCKKRQANALVTLYFVSLIRRKCSLRVPYCPPVGATLSSRNKNSPTNNGRAFFIATIGVLLLHYRGFVAKI